MAEDYDAPRTRQTDDIPGITVELPRGPRIDTSTSVIDWEPEDFDLPDTDLSGEDLTGPVVPRQADEFACTACFLVHHRSREARSGVCVECA